MFGVYQHVIKLSPMCFTVFFAIWVLDPETKGTGSLLYYILCLLVWVRFGASGVGNRILTRPEKFNSMGTSDWLCDLALDLYSFMFILLLSGGSETAVNIDKLLITQRLLQAILKVV